MKPPSAAKGHASHHGHSKKRLSASEQLHKARRALPGAKFHLQQAEAALGYRDPVKYPASSNISAADRAILKADVRMARARVKALEKGKYVPEPDYSRVHERVVERSERARERGN